VPIKVTCTGCGVTLSTPDSSAGKKAKCPKCGNAIAIPTPSEEVYDAESDLLGGLSAAEMESGGVIQEDRKPCPACGEMIVRGAVKCRYCGEIFDSTLRKQEEKKIKRKVVAAEGETMTGGDWFVAIICSGIGCIAGIVWIIQGKPKGKQMLLVSLAVQAFWVLVRVALINVNSP
jgi:predicted RNA-binding Zn-ribbon protein involved in translation (DUF1610 family)